MKLTNAIVLVTGANRGLGRALVEASLASGVRRVYAGARDPAQLDALVRAAPDRVVPLALDITDPDSLAAAAARAPDVTVLFNNAGLLASSRVLASSREAIGRDFETNVFGTLAATRAFLPALERAAAAGGAAVVNVLSIASFANVPFLGAYSASKAAAFSITQARRSELAARQIRVHAVFPGTIDTDMVRALTAPKTSPDVVAQAIVEGVEQDLDDILPDPMSRELFFLWKRDPKELERQFAATMG
jgi:NAD(P)-dependent dehydrogenase (short-subunit alcohol dehydrogenase family)